MVHVDAMFHSIYVLQRNSEFYGIWRDHEEYTDLGLALSELKRFYREDPNADFRLVHLQVCTETI